MGYGSSLSSWVPILSSVARLLFLGRAKALHRGFYSSFHIMKLYNIYDNKANTALRTEIKVIMIVILEIII